MMSGIIFLFLVALAFLNCEGNEKFPHMLCVNPECSEAIAEVKGEFHYVSGEEKKISFDAGEVFKIYGKTVGGKEDLLFAKIDDERIGYIPKGSVREKRIYYKDETLQRVPYELPENPRPVKNNGKKSKVKASEAVTAETSDEVSGTTVIDGTTIISDPSMTATQTVVPSNVDSKEFKTLSIESTASYFPTSMDSNTHSALKSENSPISPTTMLQKPEMDESATNEGDDPSETKKLDTMRTHISVSTSVGDGDVEKDTEHRSQALDNEDIQLDIEAGIEQVNTERLEKADDNKETETDNIEEDLEEDDEEEDDEEDDEEEDENSDEEVGEGRYEDSGQKKHATEVQSGSVQSVEKTESSVSESYREVSEAESYSNASDTHVEVKSSSDSSEQMQAESVNKTEVASHIPSASSKTSEDTSSKVNSEDSTAKDLEHPPSYRETHSTSKTPDVTREMFLNKEGSESNLDSPREQKSKSSDLLSLGTKSVDDVSSQDGALGNTTGSIEPTIDQLGNGSVEDQRPGKDIGWQNEMQINDEIPKTEEENTLKDEGEVHRQDTVTPTSPHAHHEKDTSLHNPGDDEVKVGITEGSSTMSSEQHHLEHTTINPTHDEVVQEQETTTSYPSYQAAMERSTSEEILKSEHSLLKEDNQVDVELQLDTQIEKNQAELEISDQEKKNVDETLDVLSSDSNLSISEESSGIFSMIFSPFSLGYDYMMDTVFGTSDEVEVITESESTENIVGIPDKSEGILKQLDDQDKEMDVEEQTYLGSSSNDHCEVNPTDSFCKKSPAEWLSGNERPVEYQESKGWMDAARENYQNPFDINSPSYYGALLFSVAVGAMLICYFLGQYYIEGKRRDTFLLAKLNILEKKLMVSSTECLILKDKLRNADDSTEIIESLRSELEKLQNEKAQLEKELEVAAEAGLEMELMVSQCLSSQQDSKSLMESIEQLQLQANHQQAKTSTLENNLILKTQENENLSQELSVAEQKVLELSSQLKKVEADLIQKEEDYNEQYDELRKLYDNQKKQYEEDLRNKTVEAVMALTKCNSLETTLNETKDSLAVKENEIAVLQECLERIKNSNGEEPVSIQFQDMLDFGKLKAELTAISKERDRLKEELQGEEDARKLLDDHVKVIKEEVEKLRKCHEAAERDKAEAQTRLEVLSSYFKEKETQLQKELGAQIQKYTDASSITQHMKSLEEEVENYSKEQNHSTPLNVELIDEELPLEIIDVTAENEGSQNETLKKEILDQERGYKSQLSTVEKKARENWVAARQAERKLEESKQEASQLRNRLTMLSKSNPQSVSQNGDDSKQNMSVMDSNGEMSASPPHLGLASNSSVDSLFLDPNSSPPLVSGGGRMPPLMPPPPFPPMLAPMSPYHHPLSPPFVPLPPPDDPLYPSSIDGHRPPPLGRISSPPPPPPSPRQSPHLPHHPNSRPFHDRKGERRSASPPADMYRGMPMDDRGLVDDWRMGRYRTPPPHSSHLPDYPPYPYPHSRPHWEDNTMPPTSSFKPFPSQGETVREKKGGKSKENHPTDSEKLEKPNRHGGKQ